MICNQQKYRVVGIMMLLVLMFSLIAPVSIYAAAPEMPESGTKTVRFIDSKITADAILLALNDNDKSLTTWDNGNAHFENGVLYVTTKGEDIPLLEMESSAIEVNPKGFEKAESKDVSKALSGFIGAITNINANEDTVQQIMADIQQVDDAVGAIMLPLIFEETEADMFIAYKVMKPFLDLLSKGLGIGAVCLIILLLFSTVMDLAYIGLPVWREAQEGKSNGKSHPFGVSYEAMLTVNDVEKNLTGGDGEYRNAYLLYFKRRALTYIILAICLMYLICGGLSGIIAFVLQLVSGITG